MSSVSDWQKAAEKKQNQVQQDYLKNNQYVLDSLNQQRDAAVNELNAQRQAAVNQLNQNKEIASKTASSDARQANINRLLALRDNQNALNRAGLGTQGIVGSQVNSINNSYGRNLNEILNRKADELQNIDSQIGDTNLQFDTNINNTMAQYDASAANTRAQLEEQARQAGLQAYQNYYNAQQAEWERQMQEKQYQENVRQYNQSLKVQKEQSGNSNQYNFNNGNDFEVNTAYYQGNLNSDAKKYGTFSNGYQPKGISGHGKLKKSGDTLTFNTQTLSGQKQTVTQSIWTAEDGTKWYWDGRYNKYFEYKYS